MRFGTFLATVGAVIVIIGVAFKPSDLISKIEETKTHIGDVMHNMSVAMHNMTTITIDLTPGLDVWSARVVKNITELNGKYSELHVDCNNMKRQVDKLSSAVTEIQIILLSMGIFLAIFLPWSVITINNKIHKSITAKNAVSTSKRTAKNTELSPRQTALTRTEQGKKWYNLIA